jgi:hypothetical protein
VMNVVNQVQMKSKIQMDRKFYTFSHSALI